MPIPSMPLPAEIGLLDEEIDQLIERRCQLYEEFIQDNADRLKGRQHSRLSSLLTWYGGKSKMASRILPILEAIPHKKYVEVFGGGASLLLRKKKVPFEVYNDIDNELVNFMEVLASPKTFMQFYRYVMFFPHSRALFEKYKDEVPNEDNRVVRAAKWYLVARLSFSGIWGWSYGGANSFLSRGMPSTCSKLRSAIDNLPSFHDRLTKVQIDCQSWEQVIERYDSTDTLFYCDPPYPHGSRGRQRYQYELTDKDHAKLAEVLTNIKGNAVLSTYPGPFCQPYLDAGWTQYNFSMTCNAAGRTKNNALKGKGNVKKRLQRQELLFCSVPPTWSRQTDLPIGPGSLDSQRSCRDS